MAFNFLDQRYSLKTLNVLIDGQKISENYVRDITLNFSILNVFVSGTITLEISGDPLEKQKFQGISKIQISATDSQENEFDNTFIAYNSFSKTISDSSTNIIFQIIDEFSYKCSNTFVGKGFNGVTITDILSVSEMCGQFYDEMNYKEKDFDSFSDNIEFYTSPVNKSLLQVQNQLKEYFNCLIYQTKTKFKIKDWATIFSDDIKDDIMFKYPCDNTSYIYGVEECRIKQADQMNNNLFGVKTKMYSYNPLDRKKEFFEYDNSKSLGDIGANPIDNETVGVNFKYVPFINPQQQLKARYAEKLLLNNQYELISKGNFNVDIGQVVTLDHIGNEGSSETLSGQYLVTEIQEKIVQMHYSQRILLNRAQLD